MRKYEFIRRLRAERSQKVKVAGRKDRFLAKKTIVMTVRSQCRWMSSWVTGFTQSIGNYFDS